MRFDLLPAKYLSRFPSQAGKKGKFSCRQDNVLSSAGYLLACQINLEIADDNAGIGLPVPPPSDDRLEASVEFRNRKRFCQVIICAQGESSHAIIEPIERREDNDWRIFPAPSPSFEQLKSSLSWGHHVEHDGIIAMNLGKCLSFFGVLRLIHGMA